MALMALNDKRATFVEEYLKTFNRTQAALNAGYSPRTAYSIGANLMKDEEVRQAISARLTETAMSADEVMRRLAAQARSDIGDFIGLTPEQIKQSGKSQLIKKFTRTVATREAVATETITIEMHDAQAALQLIGKHHMLFVDRTELTGKNGGPIEHKSATDLTDDELTIIASGGRKGTPEAPEG